MFPAPTCRVDDVANTALALSVYTDDVQKIGLIFQLLEVTKRLMRWPELLNQFLLKNSEPTNI